MKALQYSKQVFGAFVAIFALYMVTLWAFWGLQRLGGINFLTEPKGDILPLLASLPFVA